MPISYLAKPAYLRSHKHLFCGSQLHHLGLFCFVLAWAFTWLFPSAQAANWSAASSERLVKLPPAYLAKAIERDFSNSALADALTDTQTQLKNKTQTLIDLRQAVEQSSGALQIELRHQYIAEKRHYLELLRSHQEYLSKRAQTKIKIFKRLLAKTQRAKSSLTPQRAAMIEKQTQARVRFERSISQVDTKLFTSAMAPESRYGKAYAQNLSAINQLIGAIKAHPMSNQSSSDQGELSREDYIRHLREQVEADLAIIQQEKTVLAYMGKLVALDAMALAESVNDTKSDDQILSHFGSSQITSGINFFTE